ncbi:hypothetical protein EMPS_01131 [Entomortierella parvispora]|uniref:Uncharacterized protein n=1 Tax=Entomortierella parvispora TaxID=205924 RepID=A0A9P3LSN0_9FUNG|nr:hypothetical protein EMPS_01131 [Entomortierella parvispora]
MGNCTSSIEITNADGTTTVMTQKMFSNKVHLQNSDGTSSMMTQDLKSRAIQISHSDGTNTTIQPSIVGRNPLNQAIRITNTDSNGNVTLAPNPASARTADLVMLASARAVPLPSS